MRSRKSDMCIQEAQAFAAGHDSEPAHASQVGRIALSLFDQLREWHGMGPRARLLLHMAALLHDTGYGTGAPKHNKASRDLILAAPLPSISLRERMIVACIARYHSGGLPEPGHKVYRDLRPKEQVLVARLAALLRVADGLDRSHAASVESIHAVWRRKTIRIEAKQTKPLSDDIAAALRKGNLFEAAYGVKLEITAE